MAGVKWVRGKGEEVRGRECRALWTSGRTWLLFWMKWEPWRVLSGGGKECDSGMRRCPLAVKWKNRLGWETRMEANLMVG